ncbi:MAG: YraN family protein [Deltaproteobacteria bacterium]|jgi:putative endonuclease|nr:YraN family protein [Deltaproteobacteria bacterium]
MRNQKQIIGEAGEAIAARHLKKNGYRIIETNYRTELGEIDLIARDKDTIVFVEVKSRRSWQFGNPKAAVTPQKQRKISMVALQYLKSIHRSNASARFDVAAVTITRDKPRIEIIKNAFELAYK